MDVFFKKWGTGFPHRHWWFWANYLKKSSNDAASGWEWFLKNFEGSVLSSLESYKIGIQNWVCFGDSQSKPFQHNSMAKLDKNNDEHQSNHLWAPTGRERGWAANLSPHDSNLPRFLELKAAPFADYHLTLFLSGPTPLCGSTHGKTAAVNLCDWH